ncbi:small integral membrane protein 8 isoform X1 [Carlito syrichta]|uniref:Small integral membrane protein 8 n=2 Tax=Carlito syrichta TaxID=1868482 RepID=A0A1U7UBE8_CARSF|nr:small integral membrane protein 8 isoform X1 [Carlito syrichta]XP_021573173.1 small integral membrane protein 8 isoform X1 [Carlito syrichta]
MTLMTGARTGKRGMEQPTGDMSEAFANVEGNNSSLIKMPSAPEPTAFKKEPPKEKDFQNPGLRGVRTTTLFRAVNPELFIKPNKPVMAFGLVTLSLCVAYIGYLHATQENKKDLYEAIDSEGHSYMRRRTSKWD